MLAMQPLRPDQSRLLDPLAVSVHPADDDHAHDHAANRSPAAAGYEVYTRRWLMLALFSFLSLTNAMVWITFAPVQNESMSYYGVGTWAINLLSVIYMIIYVLGGFSAANIIESRSLRSGLIVGGALNLIGAAVRVLPYPMLSPSATASPASAATGSFICAMIGQTIAAAAQTFLLSTPSKLAQNWFPPSERVTATSIGALFNQLGVAVGYYLPAWIAADRPKLVPLVLLIETAICAVPFIAIIIWFQSTPPSPPSASAQDSASSKREDSSPVAVLFRVIRMRNFMLLLICFGIGIGSFYCISTVLAQILSEVNYSADTTGLLGVILVLTGLAGAILFGVISDQTPRAQSWLCQLSFVGTFATLIWFTVAAKADNSVSLYLCCAVMGFFMTAMLPVGMDLCVESTFPEPEQVTTTLLLMSAQVFGILFILVFSVVPQHIAAYRASSWAVTAVVGVTTVAFLFFKSENKRRLAEQLRHEQGLDRDHPHFSSTAAVGGV